MSDPIPLFRAMELTLQKLMAKRIDNRFNQEASQRVTLTEEGMRKAQEIKHASKGKKVRLRR